MQRGSEPSHQSSVARNTTTVPVPSLKISRLANYNGKAAETVTERLPGKDNGSPSISINRI